MPPAHCMTSYLVIPAIPKHRQLGSNRNETFFFAFLLLPRTLQSLFFSSGWGYQNNSFCQFLWFQKFLIFSEIFSLLFSLTQHGLYHLLWLTAWQVVAENLTDHLAINQPFYHAAMHEGASLAYWARRIVKIFTPWYLVIFQWNEKPQYWLLLKAL